MMNEKGRTKLTEECGELITVLAKIDAFGSLGEHWDGKGNLKTRLENEIADVQAACVFLADKLDLDIERMANRKQYKKSLFDYWDRGGKETSIPWPANGKFATLDIAGSPERQNNEQDGNPRASKFAGFDSEITG